MSYTGGVITRGAIARLLQDGVRKVFAQTYESYDQEYKDLFEIQESKKAFELDVQFAGFGLAPVKPEGSGIQYDTQEEGFIPKYQPLTYAKGFIVTEEAYEDELYDIWSKKARSLAFSMNQTKELVCANVYNRSFNSSYTMVGGDGQSLLSTNHIPGPLYTTPFSNMLATPAALSETAIENLAIQISLATDPRGLRIALKPVKLIVPAQLEFEATRILKSVLQNDSANNAINALISTGIIREGHVVNHYLSSANQWFIRTDCPQGMILTNRKEVEFNEDNDFNTSNFRYKAQMRFFPGWTDPRGLYGSGNF